jgi:hypothetical protein
MFKTNLPTCIYALQIHIERTLIKVGWPEICPTPSWFADPFAVHGSRHVVVKGTESFTGSGITFNR